MRILNRLRQLPSEGRLYIYGAGGAGLALKQRMEKYGFSNITFIDTHKSGELGGARIFGFSEYLTLRCPDDVVIIASTYENEIATNLKKEGIFDYFVYKDTRQFYLSRAVCSQLLPEQRFKLLDIGARDPLSQAFWAPLDEDRLRIYAFEPDEDECQLINSIFAESPLALTCYPTALWSEEGEVPFWYCERQPQNSSIYPIDFHYFERWQIIDEGIQTHQGAKMRPVRKMTIQVTTLDLWAARHDVSSVDFAKLDTQGGELEILNGGWSVVDSMLGLILETAFLETYKGRSLFGDVDAALRAHGFHFFDFYRNHLCGRLVPGASNPHSYFGTRFRNFVESDVLYFKDPIREEYLGLPMDGWTAERIFKLVALADTCSQLFFALELLMWAEGFLARQGDAVGSTTAGNLYWKYAPLYSQIYPDFVVPCPM
jgi:FkbM family methyltransferase